MRKWAEYPSRKLPDLNHEIGNWTHEIVLRKERKGRKFFGRKGDARGMDIMTIYEEGESVHLSGLEEN
jgi:hypothetical protein